LIVEALSKSELLAVLEAAKAHRTRDWLMILIAWRHGLRASEVVAITGDDLKDGQLEVQRLKGSKRTVQALASDPDPLLNERAGLFDYTRGIKGNQKLFAVTRQHFWRLFQRHAATADIPERKRHPHVLKHTIAMQTIKTAGIENVRQFLGHKSGASTMEYLKVNDLDASAAVARALKV
jgi:type 1 fimbriae regulatory protein FimB/type 1 fimbriae regulatory protein FimE